MICYQHANPAIAQAQDEPLNLVDGNRINPGERLIEQNKLRLDRQTTRDLGAPPLTT